MAKRILFAEDDEMLRGIAEDMLSDEEYEVTAVENGQQAWDIYQKQKSGLSILLTDIGMPVMSGLKLIEKVRQDNSNFPIVAYTANPRDFLEAKKKGANYVLQKPCTSDELFKALEKALEE